MIPLANYYDMVMANNHQEYMDYPMLITIILLIFMIIPIMH